MYVELLFDIDILHACYVATVCALCRLYKEYVLEVTVLAVLGQEVWLQRGESRDFRQWIELGSNMSHGSILPSLINLPVDTFIGCEYL